MVKRLEGFVHVGVDDRLSAVMPPQRVRSPDDFFRSLLHLKKDAVADETVDSDDAGAEEQTVRVRKAWLLVPAAFAAASLRSLGGVNFGGRRVGERVVGGRVVGGRVVGRRGVGRGVGCSLGRGVGRGVGEMRVAHDGV